MDIPIQEAIFNKLNPERGLKFLSLVSKPAIEVQWIKLSAEQEQEIKLAVQDEELMQFITPVLIPNQMILRMDKKTGQPFHLVFSANTIREIAYDWQEKHLSGNVDINHSRQLIPGVHFVETFLSSEKTIPSVKNFEMLPAGTWYVVGKAQSPEAWAPIKNGEVKGVSIDGWFDTEEINLCSDDFAMKVLKKLYNA